jgi:hypothetical protein
VWLFRVFAAEKQFHSRVRDGPYFPDHCQRMLTALREECGVWYLDNSECRVEGADESGRALSVWGSPWSPHFGKCEPPSKRGRLGWTYMRFPGRYCRAGRS